MPPIPFTKAERMNSRASSQPRGRNVIVEVATSADGFIARPDGDVSWLNSPELKGQHGMDTFVKTIDTILWGRKTYTKGIELGMKAGGFSPKIKNYVFSRQIHEPLLDGFELVKEPIQPFMQHLRAQPGLDIWMMGGSEIIASFLDEGEIDEFSMNLIPIFIGEGIPLIKPQHRSVPLKLLATRKFSDGVVHLHYRVVKNLKSQGRAKAM